MLLSVLSFLVVAQSSSEVPEGLMNNPVYLYRTTYFRNTGNHKTKGTALLEFQLRAGLRNKLCIYRNVAECNKRICVCRWMQKRHQSTLPPVVPSHAAVQETWNAWNNFPLHLERDSWRKMPRISGCHMRDEHLDPPEESAAIPKRKKETLQLTFCSSHFTVHTANFILRRYLYLTVHTMQFIFYVFRPGVLVKQYKD